MKEKGIDISSHAPQQLEKDYLRNRVPLDYVVTVCGGANEACPVFNKVDPYLSTRIVHVGFDDPPKLTEGMTNEDQILDVYRRVRKEIEDFILKMPAALPRLSSR